MLTNQLRELERDGLVTRKQFSEIPPRVEYSLSPLGKTIGPIGQVIEKWGKQNMVKVNKARKVYDSKEK